MNPKIILTILTAGILIAHWARSFFGIDFTDEALYISFNKAFALGQTPFKDEFYLQQSASFLTLPLFSIFFNLKGYSDSILLFSRILFLAVSFLSLLAISKLVSNRTELSFREAAISLIPIASFAPYSIFALSYNSQMFLFLSLTFVAMFPWRDTIPNFYFFLAGLGAGLATTSYLPILPLVLGIVVYGFLFTRRVPSNALFILSGFGLGIFPLCFFILKSGFDSFLFAAQLHSSFGVQAGDIDKLLNILPRPLPVLIFSLTSVAIYKLSKSPHFLQKWFPFLAISAAFADSFQSNLGAHDFLNSLAFYLAPLLFLNKNLSPMNFVRFAYLSLVIGSFTLISFVSSTGHVAGAGISLIIVLAISFINFTKHNDKKLLQFHSLLIAISLCYFQYSYVYRDVPLSNQNFRFTEGPFRGISTHAEKANLAGRIYQILNKLPPQSTLLAWDYFPAGYLFAGLKPLTPAVWLPSYKIIPKNREEIVRYFEKSGQLPDFILKMEKSYNTPEDQLNLNPEGEDPLWKYFSKFPKTEIYKDTDFSIFQLKSTSLR